MRIPFPEIARRLTGFSTPFFGVSWAPPALERDRAEHLLRAFAERRVLFGPEQLELPGRCVESVLEIRETLDGALRDVGLETQIGQSIRAMRGSCRAFLDAMNGFARESRYLPLGRLAPWEQWQLGTALGELRAVFGVHLAQLSVAYGIDAEAQLVSIFPPPPE